MDTLNAAVIVKALDGLSQRYVFTSQNIANAGSPNYRPVRVSFEDQLRTAAGKGLQAVERVKPEMIATSDSVTSPELRLDLELAEAGQTAMRYQALINVLGRQMGLMRAVVEGAR